MPEGSDGREITLEQLMTFRAATERISSWLRQQTEDRLETLRPLLMPRRFLGHHVRSAVPEDVKDADQIFAELQAGFREVSGEPFRLPGRLDSPVDAIPQQLVLHPWEYSHDARGDGETRPLTVKSPVSWVLLHSSALSLSQARQMLAGKTGRSDAELKQFAVCAVFMKILFDRNPGLVRLFEALRFRINTVPSPETGKLVFVRLTSEVPAFRPADSVIVNATRLSGVPIFEELVDVDAALALPDPLRNRVAALVERD